VAAVDITGAALFDELTANVHFKGVTGEVRFDSAGDRENPTFSLSNYRTPLLFDESGSAKEEEGGVSGEGEWVVVGNATETSFWVNISLLQWPGGSDASSFTQQLVPWCAAGSEPLVTFTTGK
jgi:hypothetical protein